LFRGWYSRGFQQYSKRAASSHHVAVPVGRSLFVVAIILRLEFESIPGGFAALAAQVLDFLFNSIIRSSRPAVTLSNRSSSTSRT
jgi:hypothetical protein